MKYWRTMICAFALGACGLAVWAGDCLRGNNRADASPVSTDVTQTTPMPAAAPQAAEAEPPTKVFDLVSSPPKPVNAPVVPPVGPSFVPVQTQTPPPVMVATDANPQSTLPDEPPPPPRRPMPSPPQKPMLAPLPPLPDEPPPIPKSGLVDANSKSNCPVPPIQQAAAPQSVPPPQLSPGPIANDGTPVFGPIATAPPGNPPPPVPSPSQVQAPPGTLPPLPAAAPPPIPPSDSVAPMPPASMLTPTATSPPAPAAAHYKLHLHMGGTTSPHFEVYDGDTALLRVHCDQIEMHQAGPTSTAGLIAHGNVRVSGSGLSGTCDELSVTADKGEVRLKGNVHLHCYRGNSSSQVDADSMSFQLKSSAEVPHKKPAGASGKIVPAKDDSPPVPRRFDGTNQ